MHLHICLKCSHSSPSNAEKNSYSSCIHLQPVLAQLCPLTFSKIRELGGFSCNSSQAIGQGLYLLIMGCDLFIA